MSGHRQAALALHALSRRDQELILAELPGDDQQQLRAYLAELTELGFDAPQLAADANVLFPPKAAGVPGSPRARLHGASAGAIFGILGAEPAALAAQVLRLADWPWSDEFLIMLPGARRAQVQAAAAAAAPVPPARARFLIEAVAGRLAEPPKMAIVRTVRQGLFSKVSAWMR